MRRIRMDHYGSVQFRCGSPVAPVKLGCAVLSAVVAFHLAPVFATATAAAAGQPVPDEKPATVEQAKEKLPDAADIVKKFIEVTGGVEAHEKIEGTISTGTFEMPSMGIKGDFTIHQAAPNKMRFKMNIPGMGAIDTGTDGAIAWEVNDMMGPRLLEGPEKMAFLRSATFNLPLKLHSVYPTITTTGVEDVKGDESYKLLLTPAEGEPQTWFFSVDSGLMTKQEATLQSPMGEITSATYLDDYREVDGVKVAFNNTIETMGMQQKLIVSEVKTNPEMPEGIFDPPAAVKELVESMKKGEEDAGDHENGAENENGDTEKPDKG